MAFANTGGGKVVDDNFVSLQDQQTLQTEEAYLKVEEESATVQLS